MTNVGGPLEGIRVLDLGLAGVGPYAASLMAQLGADVIKVEPPWGDIINRSGGRSGGEDAPAPLYVMANLGKRGIVLDLKDDADRARFMDLVRTADVYMENMKAGTAEHMGVGYETLSAVNPRLVWVNSSGFGDKGPLREMGSFEGYSDAMAGVSSVNGVRGGPPQRLPGLRIDPITACCLVTMVLAGLVHRERTGEGQRILGSQFQSALQFGMVGAIEALNLGTRPGPWGTEHPHVVPSRAFAANDGDVAVTAQTEAQWQALCEVLGRADLFADPRFTDNAARVEHRDALHDELEREFRNRSVAEWVDALQARRVPSGPFLTKAQHLSDPHIQATGMLATVQTHWGPIVTPWTPARFSRTPAHVGPGPRQGEHTDEVLRALGAS